MEYITAVAFRWGAGHVCRAVSVECLELCDKSFHRLSAEVSSRQGAKPACGLGSF
ncbi:MAG: hypothetical protein NC348_12370 [Clostridium sp.]|nr:hypothetical protein [Clostridium sp.]